MKRCLVADTSEVIRKVARHFLEADGYEVFEADTAQAALALLGQKAPDLLILDWHLAGMTTLEFLSALRFSAVRRPHIVYFTAEYDAQDMSRMLHAGCNSYLLKPFDRASWSEKMGEIRLPAIEGLHMKPAPAGRAAPA